ncbi:MAG: peptidoglycan bridge formation glycyltransferase FemA/FemB family protein [bacterium]|nr:peptidoglycan bridge formation glycyltransferase FemA/FemB family protein [bacterium]
MPINIKIIESAIEWREAEALFKPHTFLQSWEWSLSQEALGQKIFRLGIFNENKIIGLAFFYLIKAKRGSFLFCPHGPIINWPEADTVLPVLLEYLVKLAKEIKADFIRLSPLAKNSPVNKKIIKNLGFRPAPVHMMHPELSWMIDLTPSLEIILNRMEKRTRYSIRKAEKDNVEIISSSSQGDLDKFYELYKQTADRQGFVPYTKDYLEKELQSFLQNDKIKIYLAYYHKELIAAAMVVYANNSAFYHHGASIRKFSNITASELLQWAAIEEAKKNGLSYYNFWGIVRGEGTKHPWAGLSKFKKGFGGFEEEYLHAQDYVLSIKYWLNYLIEIIRKIKRGY